MKLSSSSAVRIILLAALLFGMIVVGAASDALALEPPDRAGVYARESSYAVLFGTTTAGSRPGGEPELRFQPSFPSTALIPPFLFAGDFDGDGYDSIGTLDVWTTRFALGNENAPADAATSFLFGTRLSQPVAGDFDGDGIDTIGVFEPGGSSFQLRNTNAAGPPDIEFVFGPSMGYAITGDFDGDGTDTIGVYEPATATFRLRNTNSAGPPDIEFVFGPAASVPFAGDFDGDGVDGIGVLDAANHRLLIRHTPSAGAPDLILDVEAVDWDWIPLAGRWQIPESPESIGGYPFETATPEEANIDPTALGQALDTLGAMAPSRSALVLRNGSLVAERYYNGARSDLAGNIKSVSKSVLSALIGIAIARGHIDDRSVPVARIVPELFARFPDAARQAIRVENLLTMSAGLNWNEIDLSGWLYSPDWIDFVIEKPVVQPPGQTFLYSTGLTHLAAHVLERATGTPPHEFARRHLFDRLGIIPARWERDPQGRDVGGFELYLRPRDMARFGEHYLGHDNAKTDATVPREWREWSTSHLIQAEPALGYGGWWWRRSFGAYDDVFFAWGYGGQFIFLFPSLDLNVVVTSRWNVNGSESLVRAYAVFAWLENDLLPAVK